MHFPLLPLRAISSPDIKQRHFIQRTTLAISRESEAHKVHGFASMTPLTTINLFQSSLLPCMNGAPGAPLGCISATSFPADLSSPPATATFPESVDATGAGLSDDSSPPLYTLLPTSATSGAMSTTLPQSNISSIERVKLRILLIFLAPALAVVFCG